MAFFFFYNIDKVYFLKLPDKFICSVIDLKIILVFRGKFLLSWVLSGTGMNIANDLN